MRRTQPHEGGFKMTVRLRSKRLISWLAAAVLAIAVFYRPVAANGLSAGPGQIVLAAGTSKPSLCSLQHQLSVPLDSAHATGMIPINMSLPSASIQSGSSFSVSVTVDSVPSGGGYVQVGCTQPELFTSPSGVWPYQLQYADCTPTTATFTVQVSPNAGSPATFFACTAAANPDVPSEWSVYGIVSVSLPPP